MKSKYADIMDNTSTLPNPDYYYYKLVSIKDNLGGIYENVNNQLQDISDLISNNDYSSFNGVSTKVKLENIYDELRIIRKQLVPIVN